MTETTRTKQNGGPEWQNIRDRLSAPFSDEEVGQVPIDRSGRLMGRYITASSVMDRLDDVVGPESWNDDYEKWDEATCAVKCTLTVFGISRSDVGYPNDPSDADNAKREPFKAACSDALKRAAVHWGIGRYLYPKPGERGASPDAATRASKPASEKQVKFVRDLAAEYKVPLPNEGDLDGLPMDVASRWIEELRAHRESAELSGWGAAPEGAYDDEGRYVAQGAQPDDSDMRRAEPFTHRALQPAMVRPASANQLATIAKLSRLLGSPEEPSADLTSAEASDRITELSRLYNERKGGVTRRTA